MSQFTLSLAFTLLVLGLSNATVPLSDFYPWGAAVGDADLAHTIRGGIDGDLDDGSTNPYKLTSSFRYFNEAFDTLWVNINGGVSFRDAIRAYTPICAPLTEDMSMISPFWADVDLRALRGNGSYRQTNDKSILDKALVDVHTAFPDLTTVVTELKWAFVATWYQVHFYDDMNPLNNKNVNNTFQMVLTTDDHHSFAIFYYNEIMWTTGTALKTHGDNNGLPIDEKSHPARAGFDNGKGKYFKLPGSCEASILHISSKTSRNGAGKFVFQVDGDTIVGPTELPVITDTMTRITGTDKVTEPSHTPTEGPTESTTISEEDFHKHKNTTGNRLIEIRRRLEADCEKIVGRLALEKLCFHELRILNDLAHELEVVKYIHELVHIDMELDRVADEMLKIEQDITFFSKFL